MPLGIVDTLSLDTNIDAQTKFKSWLNQAESKGACNQGSFDYTKYFQSNLQGSVSLCDAANKSYENSTSLVTSLRDQSKLRLRNMNNAAIDAWKDCLNSRAPGFKDTYKIIPDSQSIQLILSYIPSVAGRQADTSIPVRLSEADNLVCNITSFRRVNMNNKSTRCTIANPFKASSIKITAEAINGVHFLNVPKLKRNPIDPITWKQTISCGTSYRYFDDQGHEKLEKATRQFTKDIETTDGIYYLYLGNLKDRASILFNKAGYANTQINDEAVGGPPDHADRTRDGFTDYISHGCGKIFVEDLPS